MSPEGSGRDDRSAGEALGEFEHLVLLAILRLGDECYGVPIRDEIEERAGRAVTFGAVYATLRRLEAKGWVASRMSEPEPVPGGRARKLVSLTPLGLEVLRAAQERLARMVDGLEGALEGG